MNPLFGTIYNSIYLLAKSISSARAAGMHLSGSHLAYYTKNITFSGFNQKVQVDTGGEVKTGYIILDTDNTGGRLYPTYAVDLKSGVLRFAGRSINFPGGSPPPSDSSCWFVESAVCTGGQRLSSRQCHSSSQLPPSSDPLPPPGVEVTYIVVVFAVVFTLALLGLAIGLYIRYSPRKNSCAPHLLS